MTDQALSYGDPLSIPFWQAAEQRRLMIQRCTNCGHHQLYPRPFCLECYCDDVVWIDASGAGIVYSKTIVHITVSPDMPPPYVVAIVELDEGPRLTTNLTDLALKIGDRVKLVWRDRQGAPPFPVFAPAV